MATLKKNHLIEKRNVLNEIRANNMTLQELRFFSIYLSKINARDISTRVVRFPIDDFQAIMELGRIDINYMKSVTNSLLCKVVNVPIEDEKGRYKGYTGFQLFKECTVSQDDYGGWYVEIDAHDKALPLMFEFKNRYFTYQLFNALRLRSPNQLRMYEILKQYEKVGSKIYTIEELKKDLWIREGEYGGRWNNFKTKVLDACQEALRQHTDIKFTYEPYGKKGLGGKILALKFYIEKNNNYIDQLTLDMFIDEKKAEADSLPGYVPEDIQENINPKYRERIELFMEACENVFNFDDVVIINDLMNEKMPYMDELECYNYLNRKYKEMMRNDRIGDGIKNKFKYFCSIIGTD